MAERSEQLIQDIAELLLRGEREGGRNFIREKYPHCVLLEKASRSYTEKQKMEQFVRDGFIDRYSGKQLLNPGILRVISYYFPDEFPYQEHWKMESCHRAYWELVPTIDHIVPIAVGGKDEVDNWATTSMLNNSIKSNFTLEQLRWELHSPGAYEKWDGLTDLFLQLVESDKELLEIPYIKRWYSISKKVRKKN